MASRKNPKNSNHRSGRTKPNTTDGPRDQNETHMLTENKKLRFVVAKVNTLDMLEAASRGEDYVRIVKVKTILLNPGMKLHSILSRILN